MTYIKLIIQQKQLDWQEFSIFYFETSSAPTAETLFLLVVFMLVMESADSIDSHVLTSAL